MASLNIIMSIDSQIFYQLRHACERSINNIKRVDKTNSEISKTWVYWFILKCLTLVIMALVG